MLFAPAKRTAQKHMIERSLFLFEAATAKPDMSALTWAGFVKLCAEKSVTSAKDFAVNGKIPLNPAAGISADGKRKWLHTRKVYHTYASNGGVNSGSFSPISEPKVPSYRYMERQFALNLSDNLGMVMIPNGDSIPQGMAVFGIDRTLPLYANGNLNSQAGNTMYSTTLGGYSYGQALDTVVYTNGSNYSWNSNGSLVMSANALPNDGRLKYGVVVKVISFNNSGGSYWNIYWGIPNVFHDITGGTPGVSVPVWGMAAFVNEKKEVNIALLLESDIAEVKPVMDGEGTARLSDAIKPQYTFEM